jgi:hypothetical protein
MRTLVSIRNCMNLGVVLTPLVAMTGCGADGGSAGSGREPLNSSPATLEQAASSISAIIGRLKVNREDAEALATLTQIKPKLDELNHLLARVEPQSGYVISFYEPEPGSIAISERGPQKRAPLLGQEKLRNLSPVELYRSLASSEPPEALLAASERAKEREALQGGPEVEQSVTTPREVTGVAASSATSPAEEVAITRQAISSFPCFNDGDSFDCLPDWGGGGFQQATAKTSFFRVQSTGGDAFQVQMHYSSVLKIADIVSPGDLLSWSYHSSTYTSFPWLVKEYNVRTHRWDIMNASGDSFAWTWAFRWTCGGIYNCNIWPD